MATSNDDNWTPVYTRWRHGGWYTNARYPSGACGCVSRNYPDKKWRIVCDARAPFDQRQTYPNRDAAARAEKALIEAKQYSAWEAKHVAA